MKFISLVKKYKYYIGTVTFLLLSIVTYFIFTKEKEIYFIGEEKEISTQVKDTNKISYGFLPYWVINSYNPDYDALTDLVYFGFFIDESGNIKKVTEEGTIDPSYNTWQTNTNLHNIMNEARKSGIRTHIALVLQENDAIENFLNCKECWETSYTELKNIIEGKDITGINYDFEYSGPIPIDLDRQYADYVFYMSSRFRKDFGNDFMAVVSTFGNSAHKERLMNIEYLDDPLVDYIFIMAYDFFNRNSSTSGPVAPLSGALNPENDKYNYDLSLMINDYKNKISEDKLILGMAFYGYNWLVEDYRPYSNRLAGTPYSGYSISQFYSDIIDRINTDNIEVFWDEDAKSPFFTYLSDVGTIRQVYFENERSIREKTAFAIKHNLKGIGIWALGYEGDNQDLTKVVKDYLIVSN